MPFKYTLVSLTFDTSPILTHISATISMSLPKQYSVLGNISNIICITFSICSRFVVDIGADANFTIRPFWVPESNFRSCDVTGGIPIITHPTRHEFIVQPEYLKLGANYFIGEFLLHVSQIVSLKIIDISIVSTWHSYTCFEHRQSFDKALTKNLIYKS